MSSSKKFAAFVGLIFTFCVSAPALAQDILVIDAERLFQESRAGQDMRTKLGEIRQSMSSELSPERSALETEERALVSRLQGKTREQIAADQALVSQVESRDRKVATFAQKENKRRQELAATERQALSEFANKLRAATETIRSRRNAKIVLDKTDIYLFDAGIDVTSEVLQQLNQTAPTIVVQRVTLPDQPIRTNQ